MSWLVVHVAVGAEALVILRDPRRLQRLDFITQCPHVP